MSMVEKMLQTQHPPWEDNEFLGEIRRAQKQGHSVVVIDPVMEQYIQMDRELSLSALHDACKDQKADFFRVHLASDHDGSLQCARKSAEELGSSLRTIGRTFVVVSRNLEMLSQ